ncbi:MAG: coenzyme F420-0:L-glutamate ligase [archaeon GBS-70-058]|nr:coenzyme F420-0:L-glutamate ligase [Candidatus Culexarchaeum nevadense]
MTNGEKRWKFRGYRKPFKYWIPGTNIVNEILKGYGKLLKNGDLIAISEKAICTAKGNIYDESRIISIDPITKISSYIVNKLLWGKILSSKLPSEAVEMIRRIPIKYMAPHKKLALKYGGLIQFLKPYSEAGIDATNLPYTYVSLPLKEADREARYIKYKIERKLKIEVNILIVDTDRTFKIKGIDNIAITTRPSTVNGLIDMGGLGFIIGKIFKNKLFEEYPTPIAYKGTYMNLTDILEVTKFADKMMGHGFGRNVMEMLNKIGKRSFEEVKWSDMYRIKHYPAIVIRRV